jgi:hypothetical protein
LNRDGGLDGRVGPVKGALGAAGHAALACLGDTASRSRALEALVSRDESDIQVAAAYLRHRPIGAADELRSVVHRVARMDGTPAQVRALETIARQRVADRETLDELSRLHARTRSLAVKAAIEEVFLRSEFRELGPK